MVDDLESLLSDIDGNATFDLAGEQFARDKERLARRGDRTLIDPTDNSAEAKFLSRIKNLAADQMLNPFRAGYVRAFASHAECSSHIRTYLQEKDLSEAVSAAIRKYRYSWERNIGGIDKIYTEFLTTCNPDMLMKDAKHDFHLFFSSQEISTPRLNFIVIKSVFLKVREYNSHFRKEWDDLAKGISVLNMLQEGKQLFTLCNVVVADALHFCEQTDIFVQFLAALLSIPKDDIDVLEHEITNKIVFFESFDYDYEKELRGLAQQEKGKGDDFLDIVTNNREEEFLRSVEAKKSVVSPVQSEAPKITQPAKQSEFGRSSISVPFTVKGTSTWNTREPYTIRIDQEKLVKDYADLENSIYYNSEIPDNVKVGGQVKRAMIHFLRDPSQHIIKEYEEFIFKIIPVKSTEIASFFGISGDVQRLFIYHLAPLTMQKILVDHFQQTGQGLCYKLHPDNRVSRYVPGEFIKEKVLLWYEENINALDLPFDRVSEYNEIKRIVSDKYNEEREVNNQKVDRALYHYQVKTGKVIDKEVFLRKKASELFGSMQIIVYMRFIDRTIFK